MSKIAEGFCRYKCMGIDHRYKHGHCYQGKTKEYNAFSCIKKRCELPNDKAYERYGGRGIECHYQDFAEFIADVGPAPSPKHQIDRKDNSGHYEAGNCQWATAKENCRNRRSSKWITYQGQTKTMAEWAEITGVPYKTLHYRISQAEWDIERAFTQPVKEPHAIDYKGEQLTIAELARREGLHINTVVGRYNMGVRGEKLGIKAETCQHDKHTGKFLKRFNCN